MSQTDEELREQLSNYLKSHGVVGPSINVIVERLTPFVVARDAAIRLDEVKRVNLGKNPFHPKNVKFFSGFGAAANTLQKYKSKRIAELINLEEGHKKPWEEAKAELLENPETKSTYDQLLEAEHCESNLERSNEES